MSSRTAQSKKTVLDRLVRLARVSNSTVLERTLQQAQEGVQRVSEQEACKRPSFRASTSTSIAEEGSNAQETPAEQSWSANVDMEPVRVLRDHEAGKERYPELKRIRYGMNLLDMAINNWEKWLEREGLQRQLSGEIMKKTGRFREEVSNVYEYFIAIYPKLHTRMRTNLSDLEIEGTVKKEKWDAERAAMGGYLMTESQHMNFISNAFKTVAKGGLQNKYMTRKTTVTKRSMRLLEALALIDEQVYLVIIGLEILLLLLTLGTLLGDEHQYFETSNRLEELGAYFTKMCIPAFGRTLEFAPYILRVNIAQKTLRGMVQGEERDALLRVVYKVAFLDATFATANIFEFPLTIECHRNGVKSVSPSNTHEDIILTGGYDGLIKLWSIEHCACIGLFGGHKSIVTRCIFTKDDRFIVSSSFDHTVRVWNSRSATEVFVLEGHDDAVTSCDVCPNDTYIASCSIDGKLRLWRLATGECMKILKGHTSWVKVVRFSSENTLVSGGLDGRIVVWDLADSAIKLKVAIKAHANYILDLAPVGPEFIITSSSDRTYRVWNLTKEACVSMNTHPSHWACAIAVDPEGQLLCYALNSSEALVFDISSGRQLRHLQLNCDPILSVSFKGCDHLLFGTAGGKVILIQLKDL